MGIFSPTAPVGFHGRIVDTWFTNAPQGSTFVFEGQKRFAALARVVVPWNNTAPVT
jgi:hypothetical protein